MKLFKRFFNNTESSVITKDKADVYEFNYEGTFVYGYVVHTEKLFGHLIQLPEVRFSNPQTDFPILGEYAYYSTFFPIGTVVKRGFAKKIGKCIIPEAIKQFPLFRSGVVIDEQYGASQKPGVWNGITEREPHPDEDISIYPVKHAVSYPYLMDIVKKFPIIEN